MERKLASIQKIVSLDPIPNADRIEKATVLGWECVVEKGLHKVGDLVIYVEVDSILPERPEFEFMRPRNFRVKTIKLRKCTSQGLILPLSLLPNNKKGYKEGDNVTEMLGITKYLTSTEKREIEKENIQDNCINKFFKRYEWYRRLLSKKRKERFPKFIRKTDETRIQNLPNVCTELENVPLYASEKLDGCLSKRMQVMTDQGPIFISKIVKERLPVKVLSYNKELNICEFKEILDYHQIKRIRPCFRISVGSRGKGNRPKYIECTNNHEFYTSRGWVRADELKMEDVLYHYSKEFPYEVEQLLLGCLLGDSSLNSNNDNGNYRVVNFNHGESQKEYLDYKKQLLGSLYRDAKPRYGGYEGSGLIYRGFTVTNLSILNLIQNYCLLEDKNSKRVVTKQWAERLDPISIAFWFMDDGNLTNRDNDKFNCRSIFCTQSFSLEECKFLRDSLNKKFNMNVTIGNPKVYKGPILQLNVEDTEKLCSIIAPYICKSMKYKLPQKYEDLPCIYENFTFSDFDSIVETRILNIEEFNDNKTLGPYVYDLTVEDNENYFAHNILVHNCSATYALVKSKKWFGLKTKFEFIVCSRNIWLKKKDLTNNYWKIAEKYKIEEQLKELIGNRPFLILQGEMLGPGIQGNIYKLQDIDFYAFNLIENPYTFVEPLKAESILYVHGIKHVPILKLNYTLRPSISECIKATDLKSKLNNKVPIEGIVCRNYDKNISFKIINPKHLLKYDE